MTFGFLETISLNLLCSRLSTPRPPGLVPGLTEVQEDPSMESEGPQDLRQAGFLSGLSFFFYEMGLVIGLT